MVHTVLLSVRDVTLVVRNVNNVSNVEQCEQCEQCETCEACEICETCEECPNVPECPTCSSCCCALTWGDLEVDFGVDVLENDVTLESVCFTIRFEDETEINKYVGIDEFLLSGTTEEYSVGIILNPAKRVVFVEVESIEFN